MSNRPKIAGTRWESAIVAFLQEHGFKYAERRALRGKGDAGDVLGVPGWCIEASAERALPLGEKFKEAEREARNAGCSRFVVFAKRRQKGVGDGYAILSIATFVDLLAEGEVERLRQALHTMERLA